MAVLKVRLPPIAVMVSAVPLPDRVRSPQPCRSHSASRWMSPLPNEMPPGVRERAAGHQDRAVGDILCGADGQCARGSDLERLIDVVDCDRGRRNDTARQVEFQRGWRGSAYGKHKRAGNETSAGQVEDAAGCVRAGCDCPLGSRATPVAVIPPPTEMVPAPSMAAGESFLRSVTPPRMFSVSPAVIRRVVDMVRTIPSLDGEGTNGRTRDIEGDDVRAVACPDRHDVPDGSNLSGVALANQPRPVRRAAPVARGAGIGPAHIRHVTPPRLLVASLYPAHRIGGSQPSPRPIPPAGMRISGQKSRGQRTATRSYRLGSCELFTPWARGNAGLQRGSCELVIASERSSCASTPDAHLDQAARRSVPPSSEASTT